MPDDNRISATITQADKDAILAAIATIESKLPFLVSLTPEERITLPKMSDKSLAFDEKAADYMASLPDLVPGFVEVAEVDKDRALRGEVAEIARKLGALNDRLDDTLMLISSEIWMSDLSFYQSVRQGAKRGIAGAQAAYEDLAARFPGNKAKTATAPVK